MKRRGSDAEKKRYTAGDLKATAGMSYRQLNDWETKGAVSADKNRGEGWRKFSARDLFAIMVCSELRNRFGIPIEQIKFVKNFMCQDGVDHCRAAFKLMNLGLSVYLLTDFKATFVLNSDLELESLMGDGYFRDDRPQEYIFLRLNDIVNRLLGCLKEPMEELKPDNNLYREIAKDRARITARTLAEQKLLDFIRRKNVDKITVSLQSGIITRVELERPISVKTDEEANTYLVSKESDFETVEFSSQDSKVVKARRKNSYKLGNDDNKRALFATRIQTE